MSLPKVELGEFNDVPRPSATEVDAGIRCHMYILAYILHITSFQIWFIFLFNNCIFQTFSGLLQELQELWFQELDPMVHTNRLFNAFDVLSGIL